jgi:hypothetical protein
LASIYLAIREVISIEIAMNVNEMKVGAASQSGSRSAPTVVALAHLLQRLESGPLEASADQYRLVAEKLKRELALIPFDARLEAVLRTYPAASDIYENSRYELAGLCRVPLEQSASTELQAKKVIEEAARRSTDA